MEDDHSPLPGELEDLTLLSYLLIRRNRLRMLWDCIQAANSSYPVSRLQKVMDEIEQEGVEVNYKIEEEVGKLAL